jgi:hypothetical protein
VRATGDTTLTARDVRLAGAQLDILADDARVDAMGGVRVAAGERLALSGAQGIDLTAVGAAVRLAPEGEMAFSTVHFRVPQNFDYYRDTFLVVPDVEFFRVEYIVKEKHGLSGPGVFALQFRTCVTQCREPPSVHDRRTGPADSDSSGSGSWAEGEWDGEDSSSWSDASWAGDGVFR